MGLSWGALLAPLSAVAIIGLAVWLVARTPGVWGWPALWGFGGLGTVAALVILHGILESRRIRRVVGEALRGRPPLTDEEFGDRFFDPAIAPLATRLRQLLVEHLECDLAGLLPTDDFESWLALSSGPDSAADCFFEELAIEFKLPVSAPWPERFGSFKSLVQWVSSHRSSN
ncbi:MAG: hypothetical protein KIS67_27625 [Verrucomicrobiae bacterium]|nr:hypothetical protein [Verrucomicrobiae bacterium]